MYEGVVATPAQVCWNVQALLFNISRRHPFIRMMRDDKKLARLGLLLNMERRERMLPRWVAWTNPLIGYVKLNIDGSSLGNPGYS